MPLPAAAQESVQRVYTFPAEFDAFLAAKATYDDAGVEHAGVVFEVPRLDVRGEPAEVDTCTVEIHAEYPSDGPSPPPPPVPDWCDAEPDPGIYAECDPEPGDVPGTYVTKTVDAPAETIGVLLSGLGGRTEVTTWCEGPGGVGKRKGLVADLPGPAPPIEPTTMVCTHPMEHSGQVVCQPGGGP